MPSAPFKKDLAQTMRVQPLPARAQNQKLQLRDERSAMANQQPGRTHKIGLNQPAFPEWLVGSRNRAAFKRPQPLVT